MASTLWLTKAQIEELRAKLIEARDALVRARPDGSGSIRLVLVETALARLENGTYGECTSCEEPLAFAFLALRPERALCAECDLDRRSLNGLPRTGTSD